MSVFVSAGTVFLTTYIGKILEKITDG